jgi:hypothetical protein
MPTVSHTAAPRKPTLNAHWAVFGAEHGIAWRDDTDHSVWFQSDDGAQTLLHNGDRSWLTLLYKPGHRILDASGSLSRSDFNL